MCSYVASSTCTVFLCVLFIRRLPIGITGLFACCFGVAGVVIGMSQVWYTGPLGRMAGATYDADLGFGVRYLS